jgi:hypothetical protein
MADGGRAIGQTKCRACGRNLRSDNRSGYCQDHDHRLYKPVNYGTCSLCGKKLRVDSPKGRHAKCAERVGAFMPARGCERCGKPLRVDNRSGLCSYHVTLEANRKARARKRAQEAAAMATPRQTNRYCKAQIACDGNAVTAKDPNVTDCTRCLRAASRRGKVIPPKGEAFIERDR